MSGKSLRARAEANSTDVHHLFYGYTTYAFEIIVAILLLKILSYKDYIIIVMMLL
jgi:hypothetical protein